MQNNLQYYSLVNYHLLPPPNAEKRLLEYAFNFQERQKIFSIPFRVANEVIISVSRYKIVHNILYTNKMPLQLFVEYSIAKLFWNKFTNWYNAITVQETLLWRKNEILYGVLRHTSSCLTLNHLIIIGKYFLYTNRVHDEKRPQFTDFVTLVYEKLN